MAAAGGDATLKAARNASYTIYIQAIHVYITTDAAQSWSFEDDATTPLQIFRVPTSPGVGNHSIDFGPEGIPLTEGKDFELDVSAAGLAGNIRWEGYSKLTATLNANSGAASQ